MKKAPVDRSFFLCWHSLQKRWSENSSPRPVAERRPVREFRSGRLLAQHRKRSDDASPHRQTYRAGHAERDDRRPIPLHTLLLRTHWGTPSTSSRVEAKTLTTSPLPKFRKGDAVSFLQLRCPFAAPARRAPDCVGLLFSFNDLGSCPRLSSFQGDSGALTHGSAKTLNVPAIGQGR